MAGLLAKILARLSKADGEVRDAVKAGEAFDAAWSEFESTQSPDDFPAVEKAADLAERAAEKALKKMGKRGGDAADDLEALLKDIRATRKEAAALQESLAKDDQDLMENEDKLLDPARTGKLFRKLEGQSFAFAAYMDEYDSFGLVLDPKRDSKGLAGAVKSKSSSKLKALTFGQASMKEGVLSLALDGKSLSGLIQEVKYFVKSQLSGVRVSQVLITKDGKPDATSVQDEARESKSTAKEAVALFAQESKLASTRLAKLEGGGKPAAAGKSADWLAAHAEPAIAREGARLRKVLDEATARLAAAKKAAEENNRAAKTRLTTLALDEIPDFVKPQIALQEAVRTLDLVCAQINTFRDKAEKDGVKALSPAGDDAEKAAFELKEALKDYKVAEKLMKDTAAWVEGIAGQLPEKWHDRIHLHREELALDNRLVMESLRTLHAEAKKVSEKGQARLLSNFDLALGEFKELLRRWKDECASVRIVGEDMLKNAKDRAAGSG